MKGKGCLIGGGILAVLVIIALMIGGWVIGKHDAMVQLDENAKAQWGNVNTAYQKRFDLVDNLVNTVKGAADYEKSALEAVIAQRANATKTTISPDNLTPENIAQFQQAQSGLSGALSRLLVSVERYPELKANQGFLNLQSSLESIEAEILQERNQFNDKAKEFNQYRNTAVNSMVAGFFPKFTEKGYFTSETGADKAKEVEFDFGNSSK